MSLAFRPSSLAPPSLTVDDVRAEPDRFVIKAHGSTSSCRCPACGYPSTRVHSRYMRRLADLPSAGRAVHLEVVARRFRCIARVGVVTSAKNRRPIWLGDERPKALKFRHAGCERPALLTSKTHERDNAIRGASLDRAAVREDGSWRVRRSLRPRGAAAKVKSRSGRSPLRRWRSRGRRLAPRLPSAPRHRLWCKLSVSTQ
jgi:zinc-finger of transposase IS204/IS1001/IS1096/IS1165